MVDAQGLSCVKLKKVQINDRSAPDYTLALRGEVTEEKEQERKDYFFSTGLDKWYASLDCKTFKTEFVDIEANDAIIIVDHWRRHFKDRTSDAGDPSEDIVKCSPELTALQTRIDNAISKLDSNQRGVFVKLSTRSPKDSHVAFAKGKKLFQSKVSSINPTPNNKLILLQEALIDSLNVKSGAEAVELLVSSTRVGEDLEYGLEGSDSDAAFSERCKLVVREWVQLPLWSEFRGFVWGRKLTALGQYNHPVVFPDLKAKVPVILDDIKVFFESVKGSIPLDNYIIDFGWTPNCVYLVEINPFDGEIVFPASTGLWNWDKDRQQMLNGPLEMRIREEELTEYSLKANIDPLWRAVLF